MLVLLLLAAEPPPRLVEANGVVKDLVVDLRYATDDNFLHKAVYPKGSRCLLLDESAKRLEKAAAALRKQGFRLKVWDCYRPHAVQFEMWKIFPKPGYVAEPTKGSNHNRGGAVDLTLAAPDGGEVELPTPFDTFSPAAHHGFDGGTPESRQNRQTLKAAMEGAGFVKNAMEWWHWDLPDAKTRPILDEPLVK